MPINPLVPNPLVQNQTLVGAASVPPQRITTTGPAAAIGGTAAPGLPPLGGAAAAPNPAILSAILPMLNLMSTLIQMMQGGSPGPSATGAPKPGGAASPASAGTASPAAGPAAGPLQADQNVVNRANSIIDQGLNSITGIGAGQAKTTIQGKLGEAIGPVNVNGTSANLNFSVNDLRDTLSYAKSLGLSAQNGRIDQAQLQSAISRAESSGAPPNVVSTLRSLNDNWGAGEQLGIIQGGALTSGGVDNLMGILRNQAQNAAASQGGIAARVGGRAITNVMNTIEQPVRQLIKDAIGL